MNNKDLELLANKICLYETESGCISVEVKLEKTPYGLIKDRWRSCLNVVLKNITVHLKTIYNKDELQEDLTSKFFLLVQMEGKRSVTRNVTYYMDAIISVGYRVNSELGIAFRIWATDKLKKYIYS